MKINTINFIIFILMASGLCLMSCSTGNNNTNTGDDIWNKTGWIDDDTYRVRIAAESRPGFRDITIKKQSSRDTAIRRAKEKLRDRYRYTSDIRFRKYGEEEYDPSYPAKVREVMRIIDAGTVIAEKYDREYTCEIIFEIKSPGLKKLCTDLYGEIPPELPE